jgi:hypothetical protein
MHEMHKHLRRQPLRRFCRAASAIALLGLAAAAFGQYAPGMTGRANDANNQVGSGGINAPVQQPYFNAANLIVTGNVSGGRIFRGFSPIQDTNSLLIATPSGGIGSFYRESISLSDILNNQTFYQTNPFYNPSQTVTSVGAVTQRSLAPTPPLPSSTSYIPNYGTDPWRPGSAASQAMPGRFVDTAVPYSSFYSVDSYAALRGDELTQKLRLNAETEALRRSPVFGRSVSVTSPIVTPRETDPTATAGVVNPWLQPYATPSRIADDPATLRPEPGEIKSNLQTLAPPILAPPLFTSPAGSTFTGPGLGLGPVAGGSAQGLAAAPVSPLSPAPGTVSTGGTFAYGAPEEEAASADALAALPQAAALVEQVEGDPQMEANLSTSPELKAQYDRAVTLLRGASSKSVETLAGEARTRANEHIRRAEEASRAGKYYDSAAYYRMAAESAPDNPLIRLGLGHAYAAAGEYLTAVFHLTYAIEHYDAFGYLNFDLHSFIPDARILEVRRADLERTLDREEDYRLRFLLGYLEYYSGLEKFGLPNLQKAAEQAPQDSVIARFPVMLKKE